MSSICTFNPAVCDGSYAPSILNLLNDGPGAHIRQNAYRYRHQVDKEVAIIRRVRELQVRLVTLAGSAVIASMVGLANFISRVAYAYVSCGSYSCTARTAPPETACGRYSEATTQISKKLYSPSTT